jgi:hypothetical protein
VVVNAPIVGSINIIITITSITVTSTTTHIHRMNVVRIISNKHHHRPQHPAPQPPYQNGNAARILVLEVLHGQPPLRYHVL